MPGRLVISSINVPPPPLLHDNGNVDDVAVTGITDSVHATGGAISDDSISVGVPVIVPFDRCSDAVIDTLPFPEVQHKNDSLSIIEGIHHTEPIITFKTKTFIIDNGARHTRNTHETNTFISDNGTRYTRHIPQVDGILLHKVCYLHLHRNLMHHHGRNGDK